MRDDGTLPTWRIKCAPRARFSRGSAAWQHETRTGQKTAKSVSCSLHDPAIIKDAIFIFALKMASTRNLLCWSPYRMLQAIQRNRLSWTHKKRPPRELSRAAPVIQNSEAKGRLDAATGFCAPLRPSEQTGQEPRTPREQVLSPLPFTRP